MVMKLTRNNPVKTTYKPYWTYIYSSAAQDNVLVSAFAEIKEDRESDYLFLSQLNDLMVEGNYELTAGEIEKVKKSIINTYLTYFIE